MKPRKFKNRKLNISRSLVQILTKSVDPETGFSYLQFNLSHVGKRDGVEGEEGWVANDGFGIAE